MATPVHMTVHSGGSQVGGGCPVVHKQCSEKLETKEKSYSILRCFDNSTISLSLFRVNVHLLHLGRLLQGRDGSIMSWSMVSVPYVATEIPTCVRAARS